MFLNFLTLHFVKSEFIYLPCRVLIRENEYLISSFISCIHAVARILVWGGGGGGGGGAGGGGGRGGSVCAAVGCCHVTV